MDEETLTELIEMIDTDGPPERSLLRELYVTFRAATDPHAVTKDVVDRRFWPALRRVPVSRHPVDLVIAGYCAANFALSTAADRIVSTDAAPAILARPLPPRDLFAFERVMNGLVVVALGGYPYSNSAVDLLAVMSRWQLKSIAASAKTHSGRRLARALDRAIRTYTLPGTQVLESDLAWFEEVVDIASGMLNKAGPHTAASSSSPSLRLARLVLMRHPAPLREKRLDSPIRPFLDRLQQIALGRDGTTDVLLRREAAWYCLEASPLVEEFHRDRAIQPARDLIDHLTANEPGIFDDLRATAPQLEELRGAGSDLSPGIWPRHFDDFAVNPKLGVQSWKFGDATWAEPLHQHLVVGRPPTTKAWRELTRAIATPLTALLSELLFTPWSGRARWVAETLRAGGDDVVLAIADSLEDLLQDQRVLSTQVVAKRAAWTIGFMGPSKSSLIRTLLDVVNDDAVSADVAADVIWALGDLLSARRGDPTGPSAIDAMRALIARGLTSFANETEFATRGVVEIDVGALVRTQAAIHAIAVQHDAASADVLSAAVSDLTAGLEQLELSRKRLGGMATLETALQIAHQTRRTATWALKQLDAAVALSYQ